LALYSITERVTLCADCDILRGPSPVVPTAKLATDYFVFVVVVALALLAAAAVLGAVAYCGWAVHH
jgi:hypothetical protein